MVRSILSKKYRGIIFFLFIIFSFTHHLESAGNTDHLKRVPELHKIGIIPVRIDDSQADTVGMERVIRDIKILFSKSIRRSGRFKNLDDNLVKELWKGLAGREMLKQEFEISAFAHLTIVPKEDSVILIIRLLGPNLETYLQEVETISRNQFEILDFQQLQEKIDNIVFRLFNRLPSDVGITSIQGKYITLSGGLSQGVRIGDKITITRSFIENRHPASNIWQSFRSIKLGEASIISASEHTSVARLVQLTSDNNLQVGDGAKIPSIKSRVKFSQTSAESKTLESDAIIIPPMYSGKKIEGSDKSNMIIADATKGVDTSPRKETLKEGNQSGNDNKHETSFTNLEVAETTNPIPNKFYSLSLGLKAWNFSNKEVKVSSTEKWYFPLNFVQIAIDDSLDGMYRYAYGAILTYGNTANSGYFGLDAFSSFYWLKKINNHVGRIAQWKLGATTKIKNLRINDDDLGGINLINVYLFAEASGRVIPGSAKHKWFTKLTLSPMGIGQIGYSGRQKAISSLIDWGLELGYLNDNSSQYSYGLSLAYGIFEISDKDNSSEFKSYTINLLISEKL